LGQHIKGGQNAPNPQSPINVLAALLWKSYAMMNEQIDASSSQLSTLPMPAFGRAI
jgi:hypothetical protein